MPLLIPNSLLSFFHPALPLAKMPGSRGKVSLEKFPPETQTKAGRTDNGSDDKEGVPGSRSGPKELTGKFY